MSSLEKSSLGKPRVTIYTDGGADPNPGPGGWGVILIFEKEDGKPLVKELKGGVPDTTNNRMELTAAIEALQALKQPCIIEFYTDSQYVQKGMSEWIIKWKKNNFKKGTVENTDLWHSLDAAAGAHEIHWHWVRGHTGNEYNERADDLATAGRAELLGQPVKSVTLEQMAHAYLSVAIDASATFGPGGWVVLLDAEGNQTTISGHQERASANQLQLVAAIAALEETNTAKAEAVQIFTDSGYLYEGITSYIKVWKKNGWRTRDGNEVKNRKLWEALDKLTQRCVVKWSRVEPTNLPTKMDSLSTAVQIEIQKAKEIDD